MRRIDHEHLPEIGGEVLAGAQIVDHLADRPMLGHGDGVAPHQPAGRFLGIGERFLDRGAVVGIERAQHGALLLLLHVLDDRDRVVGLELAGDLGDLVAARAASSSSSRTCSFISASTSPSSRSASAAASARRSSGSTSSNRSATSAGWSGSTSARAASASPASTSADHLGDEFGLQPVVLVEPGLGRGGLRRGGFEFAVAHLALLPFAPARGFLGRTGLPCRYGLAHPARPA